MTTKSFIKYVPWSERVVVVVAVSVESYSVANIIIFFTRVTYYCSVISWTLYERKVTLQLQM